jgi:hypothetical protein
MNPSLDVHFDEMYGEEMVVSSMDIFLGHRTDDRW